MFTLDKARAKLVALLEVKTDDSWEMVHEDLMLLENDLMGDNPMVVVYRLFQEMFQTDAIHANTFEMSTIMLDISDEMVRIVEKFGVQSHDPLKWAAILSEENGEVSKAVLEGDQDNYYYELVQCAAVCFSAALSHQRKVGLNDSDPS